MTSTLTNFLSGVVMLLLVLAIAHLAAGFPPRHWPTEWWLYMGGPLGVLFVGAGAVLARHLGVLQTSLGLVTGMLLGALVLDMTFPTPATVVTPVTVAGTLLTMAGLVIVTLPWRSRTRA